MEERNKKVIFENDLTEELEMLANQQDILIAALENYLKRFIKTQKKEEK